MCHTLFGPTASYTSSLRPHTLDADVCGRMLTYDDVCGRMRTYADVCGRMRTYAGGSFRGEAACLALLTSNLVPNVQFST
jgi:hypothetical protein